MSYPAQTYRPRQRGFTLIEMLVVLAVAAILLVTGMPALHDLMVRNQFAAVSNEFTGLVASARTNAIKSNRTVTLCRAASAGATACDGSADGRSISWDHWLIVSADRVISQGDVPHANGGNVTLTSANISFNSSGNLARDLPVQPTISTEKQCRTMSLYRSGTLFPKTSQGACS
ncbi:MAG: GspH/FimT family pseudopilin [Rhodocyclaceae bacterium]|nr:GspH/FimT family pseudopilin [Rhodocyclaceae bacterium]MBR4736484.1 GspH/FimT family pseudopilin [Rhodocyclaceae bacterium]